MREKGRHIETLERMSQRHVVLKTCSVIVSALLLYWNGLSFLASLPGNHGPTDFFQDYAMARNILGGKSAYLPHSKSMEEYLGIKVEETDILIPYSGHPPTAAAVVLPFTIFDYATAQLWWNILSLICLGISLSIIARSLRWKLAPWVLIVVFAFIVTWIPIRIHMIQGQWSLCLLALCTASWAAGRSGRPGWCGTFLGIAVALKFLPLVIVFSLALRRRWTEVITSLIALVLAFLGTLALTGLESFEGFLQIGLPDLARYRSSWVNASLPGYFTHLFDPDATVQALLPNPALAQILTVISSLAVVATLIWQTRRQPEDFDGEFGLALTASLLLSPLTWEHYFVLLILPLAVWLHRFVQTGWSAFRRWYILMLCWLVLSVRQIAVTALLVPGGVDGIASPLIAVTAMSLNTYGLVGFFIAQAWWMHHQMGVRGSSVQERAPVRVPV